LFVQTAMNNPRNHVIENNAADAILNLESVKRVTQAANGAPPSATEVQNALRVLGKARMAFPLNAALANSMGVSWISAGELGKAIDCFRDAASASPRKVIYCRNLGMALIRDGRLSEAEQVLKKLLPFHENDVPLNRMLCSVLLTQKHVKDAIPLVNRLKELDPKSSEYDEWLAKAGEKSQETDQH
jgi:predicted Zn-dependent protease